MPLTLSIRIRCLIALAALAMAPLAGAQVDLPTAEQLMRQSGLWSQIGSMAPQFKADLDKGMSEPGSQVPPRVKQRLLDTADTAFDPARMRATAQRTLAQGLRAVHLPALRAWYDGAAGRTVTAAEERASAANEEFDAMLRAGTERLKQATPARRELLAELVEATRGAEITTDVVLNLGVALQVAMAQADPAAPRLAPEAVRAEVQAQRPQMLEPMRQIVLLSYAHMYRDLPDEPLVAYLKFAGSAAGDHFNDLGSRAIEAALLEAVRALGKPGA